MRLRHKPSYQRVLAGYAGVTSKPQWAFVLRCSCGARWDQPQPKSVLRVAFAAHAMGLSAPPHEQRVDRAMRDERDQRLGRQLDEEMLVP